MCWRWFVHIRHIVCNRADAACHLWDQVDFIFIKDMVQSSVWQWDSMAMACCIRKLHRHWFRFHIAWRRAKLLAQHFTRKMGYRGHAVLHEGRAKYQASAAELVFACLFVCLFACFALLCFALFCFALLCFALLFVCLFVCMFECLLIWLCLFVRLVVSLFDDFVTYYWMCVCVHCFSHACVVRLWLFTSLCIGYHTHRVSFFPEEK